MYGSYLIWTYNPVAHACALNELRGLERTYRLNDGTSLAADFPGSVEFHMDPDSPTNMLLVDNCLNTDLVVVASRRLTNSVRECAPGAVEYLPVNIIDHKGRLASSEYCIIHPIWPIDCIDREQSTFESDLVNPGDIESFERLVIDESKIPPDRVLFRLKGFWGLTLVRKDLAEVLNSKKFIGLRWLSIGDYPET